MYIIGRESIDMVCTEEVDLVQNDKGRNSA